MKNDRLNDLIAEIEDEMLLLEDIAGEINSVWSTLPREKKEKKIHEEAIALKLHNFYTGCERIFKHISDDLNGGVPTSPDWHKRLLHRMTLEIKGIRPPVLSGKTEKILIEFLGFRHIVRNIYCFQIDSERLSVLIKKFPETFVEMRKDITAFVRLLKKIA